jgi:hypothetical protein
VNGCGRGASLIRVARAMLHTSLQRDSPYCHRHLSALLLAGDKTEAEFMVTNDPSRMSESTMRLLTTAVLIAAGSVFLVNLLQ